MDGDEYALFRRGVEALEAIAFHLQNLDDQARLLARDAQREADMEEDERQQHPLDPSD